MTTLDQFLKESPVGFSVRPEPEPDTVYKYFLRGKGATLGVLFESSTHLFFEWVLEDGRPVYYRPEIRYKAWPKHRVARQLGQGVWEVIAERPGDLARLDREAA